MNRIKARLRKNETYRRPFAKMAAGKLNRRLYDADLSPEAEKALNNPKVEQACEEFLDATNSKLTNGMVEGIAYAVNQGINGNKFKYLVAYIAARKTSDDKMFGTITNFVDVWGPTDYTKLSIDDFVSLTAGGVKKSVSGALKNVGLELTTKVAEDLLEMIDVYNGGKVDFGLTNLMYCYCLGADDDHLELMSKGVNNKDEDVRHELRDLCATNQDINKLTVCFKYADELEYGDASYIIDESPISADKLEKILATRDRDYIDEHLYGVTDWSTVASKIRRMRRTAVAKTHRRVASLFI